MKVIIAGSRTINDIYFICDMIEMSGFEITEVVCGECPYGVDIIGKMWAFANNITVKSFLLIGISMEKQQVILEIKKWLIMQMH